MLVLPAQLTHAQATANLRALEENLKASGDSEIRVDATALRHFDSSALAILLELRRAGLKTGKRFSLHGTPTRLASLIQLYGLGELLLAPGA